MSTTEQAEGTAGKSKQFEVTFEYNGQPFEVRVTPKQKIEAAWHRALANFGISPGDAQSQDLVLFRDGNEVDRNQTFEGAGIPAEAVLRISPRVQRAG
jgi:hypothetical protein